MSLEKGASQRGIASSTLVIGAFLCLSGMVVFWHSDWLMLWLIHEVGEEKALGAENVIRTESGEVLLTNPTGMIRWTLPFRGLGLCLCVAGVALFVRGIRLSR